MMKRYGFGFYFAAGLVEVGEALRRPPQLGHHTPGTLLDILLAIFFFTNAKERLWQSS